jgi:hypothetical protein
MAKRKFNLYFRPELVNEPITYALVKDFDLSFNILRAEVMETGGKLLIEVEGKPAQMTKGVAYLESRGVEVKELKEFVTKESPVAPTAACACPSAQRCHRVGRTDWTVKFNLESASLVGCA